MQFCELILNLHLFFEADKIWLGSLYVYLLVYDNGNDDDDDEGKDVDDDAVDDDDDGADDDDNDDDDDDGTCLVWEHWWMRIDFEQPRLQVWVQHHIKAKKLKIMMNMNIITMRKINIVSMRMIMIMTGKMAATL